MWPLRFWIWLISHSAAIFSDNPFLCKSHGSVFLCACIKLSCVAMYHVFLKPNSFFPSFHVCFHVRMYEGTCICVGVCAHACVEFWSQSQESSLSLFHPMLWSLNQFLGSQTGLSCQLALGIPCLFFPGLELQTWSPHIYLGSGAPNSCPLGGKPL